MPTVKQIQIAEDGQGWADQAAALVYQLSEESLARTGHCRVALSGGSTPRALYRRLTAPEWKQKVRWPQFDFVFGDERCVPPNDPESNFGMTRESLFLPLGIDAGRIHRMKGEAVPAIAAHEYEQTLRRLTGCSSFDLPALDLILLGLGDDGHTASLFPGTPVLEDLTHAVVVTQSPKGVPSRLTLTLGVINRATVVLFLVSGPGKAPLVRAVLAPQDEADRALPAALVQPSRGRLIWMLDRSAAGQLPSGMERETSRGDR
jgi:6-phosphogluconolactonase